MENNLTEAEKIDYIYNNLYKKEKKDRISTYIKWWTRLFFVVYLLYFYFYTIPAIKKDIIDSLKIEMPEINKNQIINKAKDMFNFDNK